MRELALIAVPLLAALAIYAALDGDLVLPLVEAGRASEMTFALHDEPVAGAAKQGPDEQLLPLHLYLHCSHNN